MSRRSTRSPLWKVPVRDEVQEELQFHLDMRVREYVEEGMSEEEARRKALQRFGDPERHRANCIGQASRRDRRLDLLDYLGELRLDLGYSLRQARKHPTLTLTILAILTLGMASTVATFSLLHAALLRPLPFPEPDRLVSVWEQQTRRGRTKNVVGPVNFLEWREQSRTLERLAAFITVTANLTGDDNPQRAHGRLVTDGYFEILERSALLGRALEPEDTSGSGQPVVTEIELAPINRRWNTEQAGADGLVQAIAQALFVLPGHCGLDQA